MERGKRRVLRGSLFAALLGLALGLASCGGEEPGPLAWDEGRWDQVNWQ
jgi:hypothetical protein